MSKKVVVIGGGAAGMMAAGTAARRGCRVSLIEKNDRLGKKLFITGKGRCNITNACEDTEELIRNVTVNSSFLYSAFYSFTNSDCIEFFNKLGVPTKVERGGRVFPVSDKSSDVIAALRGFLSKNNVDIIYKEVAEILTDGGAVSGVRLSDGRIIGAESVIVATGGVSYPSTGSTGDGYKWARELGHGVTEPKPSLVPLESGNGFIRDLAGLSLRNVGIRLIDSRGKTIYTDFGEMLFTHTGVSGPVILSASAHMRNVSGGCKLIIDLKPALDEAKLDERLQRDFRENINKEFKNSLGGLLPAKLIGTVIELSGIAPDKRVNSITREERRGLLRLLKGFEVSISGFAPIEQAIITSGGVSVKEIDPSTMQSKIVRGLYFAGEVIDVDAYTGGFNLQIAFSTGRLAGENC